MRTASASTFFVALPQTPALSLPPILELKTYLPFWNGYVFECGSVSSLMRFLRPVAFRWFGLLAFILARAEFALAELERPTNKEGGSVQLSEPREFTSRPVVSWLEAQIVLARLGFSSGSIDGIPGAQSAAALRAFQKNEHLSVTGQLDAATRERLVLTRAMLEEVILSVEEFAQFQALSPTWLGKSQQTTLGYESALEWAAERSHAHPSLIRQLNSGVEWDRILPGVRLIVPAVGRLKPTGRAAYLHISLAAHVIEAFDDQGGIIGHFPISIAQQVEKRPAGEIHVTVVIARPDYTFDPDTFPESVEGQELGRKLRLPPGPNNPVGVAWIGLDRPGYGIHGTPSPEKVGRTESHGCFRLANWDALTLAELAWVGLPVIVEP